MEFGFAGACLGHRLSLLFYLYRIDQSVHYLLIIGGENDSQPIGCQDASRPVKMIVHRKNCNVNWLTQRAFRAAGKGSRPPVDLTLNGIDLSVAKAEAKHKRREQEKVAEQAGEDPDLQLASDEEIAQLMETDLKDWEEL